MAEGARGSRYRGIFNTLGTLGGRGSDRIGGAFGMGGRGSDRIGGTVSGILGGTVSGTFGMGGRGSGTVSTVGGRLGGTVSGMGGTLGAVGGTDNDGSTAQYDRMGDWLIRRFRKEDDS